MRIYHFQAEKPHHDWYWISQGHEKWLPGEMAAIDPAGEPIAIIKHDGDTASGCVRVEGVWLHFTAINGLHAPSFVTSILEATRLYPRQNRGE